MGLLVIVKSPDTPGSYYERALEPFEDKRICEGAVDALQLLEKSPACVAVVEAKMPDMDGLEVAEAVRDIDEERGHFTWLILIGAEFGTDVQNAFDEHIDAFVEANDPAMLRAAVRAALRISEKINQLAADNQTLLIEREGLIKGQLLDPLTGLGNRRYAEQALSDVARQIESRGGAVCFLIIEVGNIDKVRDTYDGKIADELIVAVAKRIQQLVRPMDIVTYFAPGQFALVLLQPTIEQCTAECYQRIFDGIGLKSYQTSVGFLDVQIGMSICASLAETGAPHISTMIDTAQANLPDALRSRTILVQHLNVE